MSSMERNKGKLIPTGIDLENYTDDDIDNLYENGMIIIDGEVYEVVYEIKADTDCYDFADVKVNTDGSIDFHTMHYNGGAGLSEVIEWALEEQSK